MTQDNWQPDQHEGTSSTSSTGKSAIPGTVECARSRVFLSARSAIRLRGLVVTPFNRQPTLEAIQEADQSKHMLSKPAGLTH